VPGKRYTHQPPHAGKQEQAFALQTQDMPSETARSAMRLGFGCLMFLRHQRAGRCIGHPPIRHFSVGPTFRPIERRYLCVCISAPRLTYIFCSLSPLEQAAFKCEVSKYIDTTAERLYLWVGYLNGQVHSTPIDRTAKYIPHQTRRQQYRSQQHRP
jgi:hypothetical protein